MPKNKVPRTRVCWWCGIKLAKNKAGELLFKEIKEQLGNSVHVHKLCEEDALAFITGITAQRRES